MSGAYKIFLWNCHIVDRNCMFLRFGTSVGEFISI